MVGFYIKEIVAKSDSKEDAAIFFWRGLNIIQGYSNTGKTCIDFVFGGHTKIPFEEDTGYNSVCMTVVTENGEIILKEKIRIIRIIKVKTFRI